jgi:hypothetical protein
MPPKSGAISGNLLYLGIKTPGRHLMSRWPNGCVPSTYCKGTPCPRFSQSCHTRKPGGMGDLVSRTCSQIQRSSLAADCRSRQAGRSRVAMGEISLRARQRREGGRRGMATSAPSTLLVATLQMDLPGRLAGACCAWNFLSQGWKVRTADVLGVRTGG